MALFKNEAKKQAEFNKRLFTFFNTQTALIALPSASNENYRQAEYKLWYLGQTPEEYLKFYNTRLRTDAMYNTNNFYRICKGGDLAFTHANLAQAITKAMTGLVFGKEPEITASSGNKERDKKLNANIEEILKDNNKMSLFNQACEMASYSGRVGFKIVLDKDLSEYPIFEPYPKEQIEVMKSHGRITDIIFKDFYEISETKSYVLYSIYGKGYIKYKLYIENFTSVGDQGSNRQEVSLDRLEQTKGLHDQYFYYSDGSKLDFILAVLIDNKENGLSDYSGCIDDFISLDETYTNRQTYIRRSGIKLYLPEFQGLKDVKTGQLFTKNRDYDTSVTYVPSSNPNWQNTEIKRDVIEIKNNIEGYDTAMNSIILRALMTTGLSPATMGYDNAGANASGEALNIRERVSLRTRDEKLTRWSEGISKLVLAALHLQTAKGNGDNIYLERIDTNIIVDFPSYEADLAQEQAELEILIAKLTAGLITLEDAVREMYPELEEDELQIKVAELEKIKREKVERYESKEEEKN